MDAEDGIPTDRSYRLLQKAIQATFMPPPLCGGGEYQLRPLSN